MTKTPEELTTERKTVHGDWVQQSAMAYNLKNQLANGSNYFALKSYQREALDMILTKVSRILNGDPNHEDHWDDIAGYAHLGKSGNGNVPERDLSSEQLAQVEKIARKFANSFATKQGIIQLHNSEVREPYSNFEEKDEDKI